MNILPFPIWNEKTSSIEKGILFPVPKVCQTFNKKKCLDHYTNILEKKGFYISPCGLSSYSSGNLNLPIITGIRISGYYKNKKIKNFCNDFLPTFPVDFINESISNLYDSNKKHDIDLINSSLHEIRKLNSDIKSFSEELMNSNLISEEVKDKKIKSIFAASSLISVRLNIYDFDENPNILTSASKYNASIYGKFKKAAHVLMEKASHRKVIISPFRGTSFALIEVYPAFELLPYVILENAIKYSPENCNIEVSFVEKGEFVTVKVRSTGPKIKNRELNNVFNKGFRGLNAAKVDQSGGGYGLYFAKIICDLHDVRIEIRVSDCSKFSLNTIPYAEIEVELFFINCTQKHDKMI